MVSNYYKNALMNIFVDESLFNIVYKDDEVWILEDKYPKADYHYLMVPRVKIVNGIDSLEKSDIPLLQRMQEKTVEFIRRLHEAEIAEGLVPTKMIAGFHKVPSLYQLHLHIFSADLRFAKPKTVAKFRSPFLLSVPEVIFSLESS